MSSDRRLVLASASPARLSLLRQAGLAPDVVVSHVDESSVRAPRVAEQVALLAAAKAAAVAKQETDALVIGADSLLEFHGKPLGKPADAAEARDRWQRMAGRSGVLHTGQALFDVQDGAVVGRDIAVASTVVYFASPTPQELEAYVATGEPSAEELAALTVVVAALSQRRERRRPTPVGAWASYSDGHRHRLAGGDVGLQLLLRR